VKKNIYTCLVGICLVGILLITMVIGGCAQTPTTTAPTATTPAPVKTTVLKYASYSPPTHLSTITTQQVYPIVEKLTDGRVKVDVYHSESLVALKDTLDALDRGMADLSTLPLPFLTGQIPWLRFSLIPGVFKDFRGAYDAFKFGLTELVQESIYALGVKVKIVGVPFTPGSNYLMTRGKKVVVPSDLKGMKIACPSKGDIEAMTLLGASPVALSGPEIYEALTRGVVDGTVNSISGFWGNKNQEPGDYLTMVPMGGAIVSILASEMGLSKLSAVDQEIVISVTERRALEEAFTMATNESRTLSVITPDLKEVIYPSADQLAQWNKALSPLLDGYLKQTGETGQKALDIAKKYN
jgi:TRAP-type transport system periplasmic protein